MATVPRTTNVKSPALSQRTREGRGTQGVSAVANQPGRFGVYGGRYVPETLMAALEELEREYEKAKRDPKFKKRLEDLLRTYAGRPTPLNVCAPPYAEVGRSENLFEARRSAAHRGAQDQQLPGTGAAGGAHGQAARDCGDRRGTARRSHGDRVCACWALSASSIWVPRTCGGRS